MDITRLRGIGVSPGIAMGRALLPKRVIFTSRKEIIPDGRVPDELKRLHQALDRTRDDLVRVKEGVREKMGPDSSLIFEAHLLILEDPALVGGLEAVIRDEKARTEWALSKANARYEQLFATLSDDYFRQRISDVADVLKRVYRNLETGPEPEAAPQTPHILIAHDLLPSEAALRLSKELTLGVALDMGGRTSHTAILARSLGIPAVVGLHDISHQVRDGEFVIVDGTDGEVILDPPPAIRREFQSKKEKYENYGRELRKTAKLKSETLDRVQFTPQANIELPEELTLALAMGAEGVGLFRSEFIYLRRETLPTEEDHFDTYVRLARGANPHPVTIRTLDIGGEKSLPQLNIEKEPNPALGLRAVRFSLRNQDLFRVQLRAILRASVAGRMRVLVPMITEIDEVLEIKDLFEDVKRELRRKGEAFDEKIPLGVMIEVPAAAALADVLLKEVDFVSIGTNDLIQYYLAVDRANEFVSYLFKPFHPAVIRLVRSVIQAARRADKDVVVCGEMAADTPSAIVLLGFGLRTFSMNPIFIPRIKKALRSIECRTAEKIAEETLKLRTAREVEEYVTEEILLRHPQVFLTGQALEAGTKK
jgi:phosphotransferase system enzyme I (PtsI)